MLSLIVDIINAVICCLNIWTLYEFRHLEREVQPHEETKMTAIQKKKLADFLQSLETDSNTEYTQKWAKVQAGELAAYRRERQAKAQQEQRALQQKYNEDVKAAQAQCAKDIADKEAELKAKCESECGNDIKPLLKTIKEIIDKA